MPHTRLRASISCRSLFTSRRRILFSAPSSSGVLRDFPAGTFICPHLCGLQDRLGILGTMLARYPNLYADRGPWHRVGAFAIQNPEKFREFYIAHSDRIMFATDSVKRDKASNILELGKVIGCERDLLETKNFSCFRAPSVMHGLYLPKAALDDIYFGTAARALHFGPPPLPDPSRASAP